MSSQWFRNVFGVVEDTGATGYDETRKQFSYHGGRLRVESSGREFQAGLFSSPSLEELRGSVDISKHPLGKGRIVVQEEIGDVSTMHVQEENCFAVFQAASQFNTLEHTSQHGRPEHGITCYAGDRTQGPACAIACAPGTVVRNYFACADLPDRQIQNLEGVEDALNNCEEKYFKVLNGYTMADNDGLTRLCEALKSKDLQEAVVAKLRIGVQEDTQVVCSGFGSRLYDGKPQLVTQVYASAISVSYSRCTPALWEPFARLILRSLYESTLYVAVQNAMKHPENEQAKKVFLTAVGGGVFGNDMQWVHDAMFDALNLFAGVPLKVYLVSFGSSTPEFNRLQEHFSEGGARGGKPSGQ